MINNVELTLYAKIPEYWNQMITDIGTDDDLIPHIFENLPATGLFGANQAAISSLFQTRTVGNTKDDLTFLLQYPSTQAHVPCVTIEVMEEQEDEVIGGMVYEDESGPTVMTYVGGPFIKKYAIGIWTWQPDETLYIAAAIKYCLLDMRSTFNDASTFHITARPMQSDQNRFELPVYFRYYDITLEGVLDTVLRSYGKVTAVTTSATEYQTNISVKSI